MNTKLCPLSDAEVLVEYECHMYTEGRWSTEDVPKAVEITTVRVDGLRVDPAEFSFDWLDRTAEYILETLAAESERARQEYEASGKYECRGYDEDI